MSTFPPVVEPPHADLANIKAARERLQVAGRNILAQAGSAAKTSHVRTICMLGTPNGEYDVPLYVGLWCSPIPGLRVMLIDDKHSCQHSDCPVSEACRDCGCTRALFETDAVTTTPLHHHRRQEVVAVIHGTVTDLVSGKTCGPGQEMTFEAFQPHELLIHGLALVCWHPPLAELAL